MPSNGNHTILSNKGRLQKLQGIDMIMSIVVAGEKLDNVKWLEFNGTKFLSLVEDLELDCDFG